jgi:ABC-2 type transport system ATP-binding protein
LDYIVETIDLVRQFKKRKSYHELMRHPFRTEWFTALDMVNLQVKPGEVFGLLGPNGAGKTTLIKILCTLILPTSGRAFVKGYDVTRHDKEVRRAFGYVIAEERSFHWRLTARQNLNFFATLNNLPPKQIKPKVEEVLQLVGLGDRADTPFYSFSTGMRQRLAIARGLLTDPEVLFMDEPTRSLDPAAALALRRFVKETLVKEKGMTVFLASHIMEEVEYLCDRIAILDHGKILACGTLPEIRQAINKRQVYSLGLYHAPEGLLAKLNLIAGVINVQPMPALPTQALSYFRIETKDNGHAFMPDLINTVIQEGGQIAACTPVEMSLGEALSQVLEKGKIK